MSAGRAPSLPRRARILYSSASLSGNAISQTWSLWLIYFYAPPADAGISTRIPELLGVDPRVVLGVLLTATRVLEAFDDPIIGYWTDRTSTRWGRRLPFIVLGTPLWGLTFFLLFVPPFEEGTLSGNFTYLLVLALAFFLFSNLAGAPIEALLPQIARRNEDRLSIGAWQVLFALGGAVIGLSLSSLLQEFFGFAVMAGVIAIIAVGTRYVATIGVWRHARADATPSTPGFRRALRQTFSNPQFLAFLPSFVFFQVGLQMLTALLPFYVDVVLFDSAVFGLEGEGFLTFLLTGLALAGMVVALPAFRRYGRRAGKARAYRVAMLGAAAWFPMIFFAGFVPGIPELPQAAFAIFVAGLPLAGVFLFPNLITADIVDFDEGRTATRREAMFYGAQNTLEKMATAFSPLIFALVLLAGDSRDDPLGVRLVGPIAGLMVLLGWVSFRAYSLADQVDD